jgi:hypothetical protein
MFSSKFNIPKILKGMLFALLILSPAFLVAMPFLFGVVSEEVVVSDISIINSKIVTLVFLEACGVICWFSLLMLYKLLATVINSTPFKYENVRYLKYISYLFAVAGIILIVKSIVDFSILTPVIAVLALLASMFCQTLAAVFDKAIRIKEENDLTI